MTIKEIRALPPGPRAPRFVQLIHDSVWPLHLLESCARRFGERFTLRLLGFPPIVVLWSPRAVQDVLRGDSRALHSGEANEFLAGTVGRSSVLVLDEDKHARQRRVLVPPFHGERMRAHVERMRAITEESMETWPRGKPFALEPRMREITLRTILEVVLGKDALAGGTLARDLTAMLSYTHNSLALVGARFAPHSLLRRIPFLPFYREMRRIDAGLHEIIRSRAGARPRAEVRDQGRRPHPPVGEAGIDGAQIGEHSSARSTSDGDHGSTGRAAVRSTEVSGTVLDDLLEARYEDGQPPTEEELRDALVTTIVAGHDTTAVALSWTFEQVLSCPEVVSRIREEAPLLGNLSAADPLPALEYTDAALRESLRRRTVIQFIARLLQRPFSAGGEEYSAGVMLAPCIHLLHQHPDLYPEPAKFRPERFLERRYGPSEWMPFGGGHRLCIGMAFAMQQMKIVLSTVLSRCDLVRPEGARSRPVRRGLTIAPSDGTRVLMRSKK